MGRTKLSPRRPATTSRRFKSIVACPDETDLGAHDRNDEHRLLEGVGPRRAKDQGLKNLLVHGRSERGKAAEFNLREKLEGVLLALDAIALNLRVQEADLNAIGVEER